MSVSILTKVERTPKFPGEWVRMTNETSEVYPIVICCPECTRLSSVSTQKHKITFHHDDTFSLEPSYVCPFPPCTWHVWIKHGVCTK